MKPLGIMKKDLGPKLPTGKLALVTEFHPVKPMIKASGEVNSSPSFSQTLNG